MGIKNAIVVCMTVVLFVLRFLIEPRLTNIPSATGSYEAFAHIFVGVLFGGWWVDRRRRLWLFFAIALSLLELAMFLIQKFL